MLRLFVLISLVLSPVLINAQDCCAETNQVILCYTSEEDFCTFSSCRYTFDAFNMQGIRQKLANPANFGPNGISCGIEAKPLTNITDVASIEALDCRIVFLGHFADDNNAGYGTTIPLSFLNTVKEWSLKCKENLVILFQDEAGPWGYEIVDQNINPNVPGPSSAKNIFNGPFGQIQAFDQGGTFQANFSVLASTGQEVLAVDGNGRPTVVLDNVTNDLILSDVGILCNGPGDISVSPNLENNNDILACNIISVSCDISSNSFTEKRVDICANSSYELPDGMIVSEEGEYLTTLKTVENCDSVIATQISILAYDTIMIDYTSCEADSFRIEIGDSFFDLNNRTGLAKLESEFGCDSFVQVQLIINEMTTASLDTFFCSRQTIEYNGAVITTAGDTTIVIPNALGCDSIISVSTDEILFEESVIEKAISVKNGQPYEIQNTIPSEFEIEWVAMPGLSCLDCPNPTVELYEKIDGYELTLLSAEGCSEDHFIAVEYICEPYLPNILDSQAVGDDRSFGPMSACQIENYEFQIYDRWGELVFYSQDHAEKWDGTLNGQRLISGVYVYKLTYSVNERQEAFTGMVHLI